MNADLKIMNKNLHEWGDFEDWESGASAAPTGWTLAGDGSVARESTIIKFGTYSAKLTSDANGNYLSSTIHAAKGIAYWQGRTVTVGAWLYASDANAARIQISDGVGTTESAYHTGVAGWEFISVTRQIDGSATTVQINLQNNGNTKTVYFDGLIASEGSLTYLDIANYIEDWDISQDYRSQQHSIARRPGVLLANIEYGARSLQLKGKVWGATPTAARTNFDNFLKYLNSGEKDIFVYDDRFFRGYLNGQNHNYIAALRAVVFDLRFVLPNPFAYYIQKSRNSQAISSSPTSFNFSVNGTVFSKPKISFIAGGSDITSLQLQNLTTGEVFNFSGTVADGDTLEIDCENNIVLNDGTDAVAYFTGDFIKLLPGTNYLKFTGSNCTIKIDWYDRFL